MVRTADPTEPSSNRRVRCADHLATADYRVPTITTMPFNYPTIMKEYAPFAPDANGYCYLDTKHFKIFMQGVAIHLLPKHGRLIYRIPYNILIFAMTSCLLLAISFLNISNWVVYLMFLAMIVFIIWYLFRIKRYVKIIIRQRMCFACGYSLRKTPTEENGCGRCSECGASFHLGYYCHLPKGYKRRLPQSGIAMLAGSVPPMDLVRMHNADKEQNNED